MPKAVVVGTLHEEPMRALASLVTIAQVSQSDEAQLRRELADTDALVIRTYTKVTPELLSLAPRLRVVGRAGVGLDNIDLDACTARSVRVVHTPDANTQAVVECVFAFILDALRPMRCVVPGITPADFLRQREVQTVRHQLSERTLGVLGVGRIGRRVVEVASAFGMRVIYNDLLPITGLRLQTGCSVFRVDVDQLWRDSDILTLHIDARPSNRNLIGKQVLDRLKPDCLLINTSRGMVVDPLALAEWARRVADSGGRAILDVHEPEPPPLDYPLWSLPNVDLYPHLGSRTETAQLNMSWVVRDVMAVLSGRPPKHPANQTGL